MPFFEAIRLAFQTLRTQKLKSAFSIIGVFIGVMFLIAVVSVVQGMNRYMTEKFAGTILGVNTFRLRQFPDVQIGNVTDSTWRVWRRRPRISYEDAEAVAAGIRVPVITAWESGSVATLSTEEAGGGRAGHRPRPRPISPFARSHHRAGRPFTPQEVTVGAPVAVLG
jgi:putative ABC transport system permease protein